MLRLFIVLIILVSETYGGLQMMYDGNVPLKEMARIKALQFPFHVSYDTIIAYLRPRKVGYAGVSFLDVGAGSDPQLARIAHAHAMNYEAIDGNSRMVHALAGALVEHCIPFHVRQGHVQALPYQDRSFDLVHERFVLMHVRPEEYGQAIRECLRVGKAAAMFLEYDWAPMFEHAKLTIVRELLSAMLAFSRQLHIEPFMGTILKPMILHEARDCKVEFLRYVRPAGDRRSELIALCDSALAYCNELGCSTSLFEHLTGVRNDLTELHPVVVCETPHIVSAVVHLS